MELLKKMMRMAGKLSFLTLIIFAGLMPFLSYSQTTVVVTPQEYTSGMRNPLMGLRDKAQGSTATLEQIPFTTCFRDYIYYNELDNSATDGLQKVIDYTNATYAGYELINAKVIPRVILQFAADEYYWPADLKSIEGDYTSSVLRARVLKLVDNLGKAWDNDPRIAWVEIGLIGKWGEQESPVDVEDPVVKPDNKSWAQILGPAFRDAFKNKMIAVRGPSKWVETTGLNAGVYWDSWGKSSGMDNSSFDYQSECVTMNKAPYERYKNVVQSGEVAYNQLANTTDMGGNERETFVTPKYCTYVKNVARTIYTSNLGVEYSVAISGASSSELTAIYNGAADIQTAMGYRFVINQFECTKQIASGGQISINASVVNKGSAPMYENWPVAVVLVNSSRQIVWTSAPLNTNVKTWYPGSNYNWVYGMTTTPTYLTPAPVNNIQGTVTVPTSLANGSYYVGLSILEPTTGKPGAFFSVKNFFQASNTQPLAQIGIGVTPSDPTLTSVTFDTYNWFNDTRYYSKTITPQAPVADFSSNKTTIYPGETVNFTDLSSNTPTAWSWSFTGGNISTSSVQNPSVTYATVGTYSVTLTATNSVGTSAPKTVTNYITVIPMPQADPIPWSELFTYTNGTTSHAAPTTWTATNMTVQNNEISFNYVGDGTFSTGPINISSGSVKVSVNVRGGAGLDVGQDFLKLYKKVDGGAEVQIAAADGPVTVSSWTADITSGSTLELIFRAKVSSATEYYYFDNLKVESNITVPTYTITASAGANGTITPSGNVTVSQGASQSFTITPSSCYQIDKLTVDGLVVTTANSYTFTNVVAAHTINVTFKQIQYIITSSAGANGTISPSVSSVVNCGSSQKFDFSPASGYAVDVVTVNGSTITSPGTSYTFSNVSANQTISVTFKPVQYTITASAGANGTITPSGSVLVNEGASQSFTFAPASGYAVDVLTVNGSAIASPGTSYTFSNVTANHTINVTFKAVIPEADVVALTDWNTGTNNPKVAGSNRMMVVMVMGESTSDFMANSATYGGQTMTRITDKSTTSGSTTYSAIFVLKEVGVNAAATSGTINVTWSATPSAGSSIYSVLLSNVDQTATIVKAYNGLASATTISTPAIAAASGDMVVMCGATGSNNTITFNNSFIKKNESNSSWGDGTTGYKMGSGVDETPSFTQSASGRMTICAIVVKKATELKSGAIFTGIGNADENVIRVYPNPVSHILNIDFQGAEQSKEVKVFNSVGQLVQRLQTKNASAQINVQLLKLKGVVVVQVIAGNRISNHRVIIQ